MNSLRLSDSVKKAVQWANRLSHSPKFCEIMKSANILRNFQRSAVALLVAGLAAGVFLSGCSSVTNEGYRDDLVSIREHYTIQYFNVHGGTDTEILTILGLDFKDVRGINSCYLPITNRHLILFVTGRTYDDGQAVVHLADTSTHQIRGFPAYDSSIGRSIGATGTSDFERILSLDGDKLVIEGAFLDRRNKYFIDLSKPRFEKEEESGGVSRTTGKLCHYVMEDGKFSKLHEVPGEMK